MSEVIDGEATEVDESIGELVPVQHHGTGIAVAPEVTAQDLVKRLDVIRGAMRDAMERDVDYGVIPGTGSKPTLLKPGSEKLGVLFQLDIQIDSEKVFDGDHLTVMSKATVYHAPTGTRLGMGEGMCSTKESKYAYRNANRVCPTCGVDAIITGKEEYGGGFVCFKKKGGCGAKFSSSDEAITSQKTGKVENPDLPDSWNVCVKMAEKRARIDAVLAVTGASALFTQDMEQDEKATTPKDDVKAESKQPESGATSWASWEKQMLAMEVPSPMAWLQAAAEAVGLTERSAKVWGKDLSQRANRVMLHLADTPPKSSLGFWSVPELQAAWGVGFEGVVLDPPEATPVGEAF
jgi:hypothetical protein